MKKQLLPISCGLLIFFVISLCIYNFKIYFALEKLQENNIDLQEQIKLNRYIYIYDLKKIIIAYPNLLDKQQEYKSKIEKLSLETEEATQKINQLEKENIKEEFSDVYIKSLLLKRNNLLEEYDQMMNNVTANVNKALEKIINTKDINVVFPADTIKIRSKYVIDITDEVLNNINTFLTE